jgi:hypothetical protein
MPGGRYATQTNVNADSTRLEIERIGQLERVVEAARRLLNAGVSAAAKPGPMVTPFAEFVALQQAFAALDASAHAGQAEAERSAVMAEAQSKARYRSPMAGWSLEARIGAVQAMRWRMDRPRTPAVERARLSEIVYAEEADITEFLLGMWPHDFRAS